MTESAQAYLHKDAATAIRDRKLLQWFLPYVKPFRGHVALAFGSLLVCEALPFAFPTLLQKVIDGPVASKDFVALSHWIALYALLVLLHAVFVFFKTWQSQRIGVAVVHRLRTQLYDHLLHLDIPFFQKTPAGRLITRLTYDVDSLQSLLTEGFIDFDVDAAVRHWCHVCHGLPVGHSHLDSDALAIAGNDPVPQMDAPCQHASAHRNGQLEQFVAGKHSGHALGASISQAK